MDTLKRITNGTTTEEDTRKIVRFFAVVIPGTLLLGFFAGTLW